MDRSFNSPFSIKSPFSPRSRQNISSKRIVPPSFRKSSRFSVSGKSAQSVQIVLKSAHNYIERFGLPLPVLITEALTFAERNTVVSACISECGYAWVVCGRRLLIWQYRQTGQSNGTPQRKLTNQCYEMQLPQSDLAHRAELVSVFISSGSNTPSCIAISPEGVARYWPAVAHEGVTVEHSIDLQGEECDSVTNIEGLGCILATTTCTIVLIQPQLTGGRHNLLCKQLKTPSGWLGGFSKRMSSLIFGPISNEQTNETRLVRVLSVPNNSHSWTVYVVAGHSLQKWILSDNEPEQLVFVAELNRLVRDGFHNTVWDKCVGDQAEIDSWLLDIQSDKDSIIILAAAVNIQLSPQVHYALISVQTQSPNPPTELKDFLVLKLTGLYREDKPGESLSYRFLLCGTYAYLYNSKSIVVIKPQEDPDVLDFNGIGDFLLGGSVCVNTPIFFSRINGLVAVSSNELGDLNLSMTAPNTPLDTSLNESFGGGNNLSVYNMDPEEVYDAYKDTLGQFKAAFIFHVKNQMTETQDILNELFPVDSSNVPGIDNMLDKVVIEMAKVLLDDVPARDPRWSKECQPGVGSSYAMQVLHQLTDKQKAHLMYLKFLKETGLWNRLSAVRFRNNITATIHVLAEFSEKITAAIVMKSLPNSLLLENAIEKAIRNYETTPENGLTNQDIFYREVSRIHEGIQELVNCCEESGHSNLGPAQVAQVVHDTNEIVLTVVSEVFQHRHQNAETFSLNEYSKSLHLEYLPWTVASGDEGIGDSLLLQQTLTYSYGFKQTGQSQLRNALLDHFVAITDLILDGRKCHLESVKDTPRENVMYKQYCTDRHKLIKPLLQEKEYERSVQLAEKYLDFETLILVCELTENQQRLDEYMNRFANEGFSEYVYNWFIKENKQGKLIDHYRKVGKTKNLEKLTDFLADHPSISWMQQIFDEDFSAAADTLNQLASEETEAITRKKTMFSLCKLAKLAGPDTPDVQDYVESVNVQLGLIRQQEDLPDYVLQQFGYDTERPRVIPPADLIKLYICPEYSDAKELDFKKALDILPCVEDEEVREELRLNIWRAAILRDSWNISNLDSPLEILQDMLIFKVVNLAIALGADPQNLLPTLDTLIEDQSLQHLADNKNFLFLMQTGYEHVHQIQSME